MARMVSRLGCLRTMVDACSSSYWHQPGAERCVKVRVGTAAPPPTLCHFGIHCAAARYMAHMGTKPSNYMHSSSTYPAGQRSAASLKTERVSPLSAHNSVKLDYPLVLGLFPFLFSHPLSFYSLT